VLYELLTGEVPFAGENFVAVAMKHINEPPPDVLLKRPDIPLRLAAAVDRALAKDPAERFGSMDQFAWELRQCLAELGDASTDRTFIAPSPVMRESRPHRVRATRRRWPIYLPLALLLAAAAIVAGILGLGGSKGKPAAGASGSSTAFTLNATTNYDPSGGHADSHADTAPSATDGNPATYWYTQIYATPDFGGLKSGLGLVLDAGQPVKLAGLTVTTTTPGFTAEVRAGNSLGTQLAADSAKQTVGGRTTFTLRGATARYYVLWITRLPPGGTARVNEVTGRR
jgi:serine/threonine-protein kinase